MQSKFPTLSGHLKLIKSLSKNIFQWIMIHFCFLRSCKLPPKKKLKTKLLLETSFSFTVRMIENEITFSSVCFKQFHFRKHMHPIHASAMLSWKLWKGQISFFQRKVFLRHVDSVVFFFWGAYMSTKPTARYQNDENANASQNFCTFAKMQEQCLKRTLTSFWTPKNTFLQRVFERTQYTNLTSGLSC